LFDTLSSEELEFVKAIETYKAKTGKMFLSWTEVLGILKDLGYKKTLTRKVPSTAPKEGSPQT